MGLGWIHPWLRLLCASCRNMKVETNSESVFSNGWKVWLKKGTKFKRFNTFKAYPEWRCVHGNRTNAELGLAGYSQTTAPEKISSHLLVLQQKRAPCSPWAGEKQKLSRCWLNMTELLPAVEWRPEELFVRKLITPAMCQDLRFLVVVVLSYGESVPFPTGNRAEQSVLLKRCQPERKAAHVEQ